MSEKITPIDPNILTYYCDSCKEHFILEFEHAIRIDAKNILSIECYGCNSILNLLIERRKRIRRG